MDEELRIDSITSLLEILNLEDSQKHDYFHIMSFSEDSQKIPEQIKLKSIGYFEITISRKGNTEILIDGKRFKSEKSHITFLSPGQSIDIDASNDSGQKDGFILLFTLDFLGYSTTVYNIVQRFPFFSMHFSPVYFLNPEQSDLLFHLMQTIYAKFQDPTENDFEIIQSYLNIILHEAKGLTKSELRSFRSRAEEVTFQFECLVKEKKHQRMIKDYADALHISPIYLSECVKSTTGKSPKKIVTEYKIWEAKSQLRFSEKSIDEIAWTLGFADRSNFIKYFKKYVGESPRRYRVRAN